MISRLLWPWRVLPRDARGLILVAAAMPLLMQLFHVAPLLADLLGADQVQTIARTIFSCSIVAGCLLIGHMIERKHTFSGHVVAVSGLTAGGMAVMSLHAPLLANLDQGMAWRALTGLAQAVMVGGWIILWRLRHRWLSHGAAGVAALVSCVGLGLYVVTNFLIADPLTATWGWGVIHPRSIVARVVGTPWIEPMMAVVLWSALALLLRRWWRQAWHGPARNL